MYELNAINVNKVYIFDLDGTLADSMPVAVKIVLSLLDEKGISYPEDIVQTLTPLGFKGISKYYAESLGVPMSSEEIFRWFTGKLKRAYAEEICLKETAEETLRALRARGARLCVLTGSPHLFTDPFLRRTGVYDLFERVWSADDFGLQKSNPRLYAEVAKTLGVSVGDLLLIDDGLEVLKRAKEAGVATVGVYDAYSASMEALRTVADSAVTRLSELLS